MIKIIFFTFLAFATFFCHAFIDKYQKSGPDMLTDAWKVYSPATHRAQTKDNELYLSSPDQSKSVTIQQDIQPVIQGCTLKLSADMKSENVQQGEEPWHKARLLLIQNDGQKDRSDWPTLVAALTGTTLWDHYYEFFTVGPGVQKVTVTAQLSKCAGSFQLKNVRLFPVIQTKIYTVVKRTILTSWGVFSVFLIGSCFYRGNKNIFLLLILATTFVAILIGTTMPGDMKAQVSKGIMTRIHSTGDAFETAVPWDLSKIGHFCFFAVYGLVLSLAMRQEPVTRVMIHILLLAGGTEIAQFYIDDRSPLFRDFVIDAAGGILGVILIKLFILSRQRSQGWL